MFDPYARRRSTTLQREVASLRRAMVVAASCVLVAVVLNTASRPLLNLVSEPDPEASMYLKVGAFGLSGLLGLLVTLLPITLMAVAIGWPIVAYLRYSQYLNDIKRRFGRSAPVGMPLRKARLLTTGVVSGLLVFGILGILLLRPSEPTPTKLNQRIASPTPEVVKPFR